MAGDSGDDLHFDQAEYKHEAGKAAQTCAACRKALGAQYYLANDRVVCERCAGALNAALTGGSGLARLGKATVLGLGGGVVGAGLYFAVVKLTGYEIGLIAIVVGFLVGFAVRTGAGGRGGWPYQALAVAITYAAIVLTYVPLIVQGFDQEPGAADGAQTDPTKVAKVTVTRDQTILLNGAVVTAAELDAELRRVRAVGGVGWYYREGMTTEPPGPAADQVAEIFRDAGVARISYSDPQFQHRERWSDGFARANGAKKVLTAIFVFGLAAAAPFLMLPGNFIGVLIIAFAIYQAWKMNVRRRFDIKGPFRIAELPAQ